MVTETINELLIRHGLMVAELDHDGVPELDGGDEFQSTFQDVALVLGQQHDVGTGTVHTSSRNVFWCSHSGDVACIPFRAITMHAMSDDAAVHERPCIYCQLDTPDAMEALEEGSDLASNEMLLVPNDQTAVQTIFDALCKGAEANPDEMEEDEGDFFFDADAVQQDLDEEDHNNLDALVGHMQLGSAPSDAEHTNGYAIQSDHGVADDRVEEGEEQ
eukprot:jgi/Ulvmu1/3350/UM156_0007.1